MKHPVYYETSCICSIILGSSCGFYFPSGTNQLGFMMGTAGEKTLEAKFSI